MVAQRKKLIRQLTTSLLLAILAFALGVGVFYGLERFFRQRGEGLPAFMTRAVDENGLGHLQESQLVRLICTAVNEAEQPEEVYRAIPRDQRGGLSYEDFIQYIGILRDEFKTETLSCVPLSTQRKAEVWKEIQAALPTEAERFDSAQFYVLSATLNDQTQGQALLPLSWEEGRPCLMADWIKRQLQLYYYAQFYFERCAREDVETLATMMDSALPGQNDLVREKAQRTIDFYRDSIQGQIGDYQLETWNMANIRYRQRLGAQTTSSYYRYRYMDLYLSQDGRYILRDAIPQKLADKDFSLQSEQGGLRPGQTLSQDKLRGFFGELLMMKLEKADLPASRNSMLALYNDVHVRLSSLKNYSEEKRTFSGVVQSFFLMGQDSGRLQSGVYVGMPVSELLALYPFVDVQDYQVVDDSGRFLDFVVQNGRVAAVRVGRGRVNPARRTLLRTDLQNSSEVLPEDLPQQPLATKKPASPRPTASRKNERQASAQTASRASGTADPGTGQSGAGQTGGRGEPVQETEVGKKNG